MSRTPNHRPSKGPRARRWPLRVAAGLGLTLSAIVVVASFVFYGMTVDRAPKDFLGKEQSSTTQAGARWLDAQPSQGWHQRTPDGLNLVALWVPAAQPTTKTVILVHGYGSRGHNMGAYARLYRDQLGFNVLIPDDRAHGDSEGQAIGFGWLDRRDLRGWIDQLLAAQPDAQIVVHGVSMGAAAVMMLSGESLPSQVRALVEDCGYTSVAEELEVQLDQMYRLPAFPFVPATSLLTQLRAGYNFYEASALEALARNRLPVLFLHGGQDTFVPTAMVHRLFAATQGPKQLLVVPGAGHAESIAVDPAGYGSAVEAFVHQYLP